MKHWQRWIAVVLFATAMAWMESATVVYLRTLVGRLEPYQAHPLPISPHLSWVEIVREAATIAMLGTAGWLAGKTPRSRFAYFLLAFGVWDILYYVFLAVIGPWPRSVLDWDILFLIPLPWWGPLLAPASIAFLMVLGATLIVIGEEQGRPVWPDRRSWGINLAGGGIALGVFMTDAAQALLYGNKELGAILPTRFNWPLFLIALAMMAVPVVETGLKRRAYAVSPPTG